MKILLLNQAFYPDVVSTAQHASDLTAALVQAGHEVAVVCSSRGYDDPTIRFPQEQTWKGVKIFRVGSTGKLTFYKTQIIRWLVARQKGGTT